MALGIVSKSVFFIKLVTSGILFLTSAIAVPGLVLVITLLLGILL